MLTIFAPTLTLEHSSSQRSCVVNSLAESLVASDISADHIFCDGVPYFEIIFKIAFNYPNTGLRNRELFQKGYEVRFMSWKL